MSEYPHGAPCWFELGTGDQAAATAFYSGLFGWDATDFPMGNGETYTMMSLDKKSVCGAYKLNAEMQSMGVPPHWDVYFRVTSCDETAAKAESLGAKLVMKPMDVLDVGRMAMIAGPEDAVFGVWEPARHRGADVYGEPNSICWVELAMRDGVAAAAFYKALFGWNLIDDATPVGVTYRRIEHAGREWGGLLPMTKDWGDMPAHWAVYVQTMDIDATAARAKELGGKLLMPPFDAPGVGRFGLIADPQGAPFYAIQLNSAAA